MRKKYWIIIFVALSSLLLLIDSGFAMMNTYPTIGGITLTDESTFSEMALYFFYILIALGTVIMFFVTLSIGLKMITGGTLSEAKEKFKGSLIGFGILLSAYLIANTINPDILRPEDPVDTCINGFAFKVKKQVETADGEKKEIKEYVCAKTDLAEIAEIENMEKSEITPCTYKTVIGYSEKNYNGSPTVLFDDTTPQDAGCPIPNIDLTGFKSVRILPKRPGFYNITEDGSKYYIQQEVDDLSKLGHYGGVGKGELLDREYSVPVTDPTNENNKIKEDAYYLVGFAEQGYRGLCEVRSEFTDEDAAPFKLNSLTVVRSRVKEKKPGDSYIYLYPVPNCGKTQNEDAVTFNEKKGVLTTEILGKSYEKSFVEKVKEYVQEAYEVAKSFVGEMLTGAYEALAFYTYDPANRCGSAQGQTLYNDYYPGDYGSGYSACTTNASRQKKATESVGGVQKYNWTCVMPTGETDECYAYKGSVAGGVNGLCGEASNQSYSSAPPTGKLCSKGTATPVQKNNFNYWWKCAGQNGGADVDCYAWVGGSGTGEGKCNDHSQYYTLDAGPTDNICISGTPTIPRVDSDEKFGLIKHQWVWCCYDYADYNKTHNCCMAPITPVCAFTDGSVDCPLSDEQIEINKKYQSGKLPTDKFCKSGTAATALEKDGYNWHYTCTNNKYSPSKTVDCYCKGTAFSKGKVECGTANGKWFEKKPTTNLCKGGEVKDFNDISGGWSWRCEGADGESVSCKAYLPLGENEEEEGDPGPMTDPEELTDPEAMKKVCKIKVPEAGATQEELRFLIHGGACGEMFQKKNKNGEYYGIRSIKVDALTSVVIKGSNDKCLYISRRQIERSGGCIGELRGSDVYDTSLLKDAVRPHSVIIMTDE
ncbi:MAG: hypothetical protein MNSN_01200 [Minisyncoccus archaeiphilus]|uniref:pilin n=1 Tax=Minisyncoccus archaeiphilus TaxID=3238481 RepID=UPI002B071A90|nr:MAG: hypothetical protein MNSN_01200 [Candidatus Parcubacteria bacterium]